MSKPAIKDASTLSLVVTLKLRNQFNQIEVETMFGSNLQTVYSTFEADLAVMSVRKFSWIEYKDLASDLYCRASYLWLRILFILNAFNETQIDS